MTIARNYFVQENVEKVYYCISTCREGTALRGTEKRTGRSFDHRSDWVQERLVDLAEAFALEVCAYSVGVKDLHVVVRTRPDWANAWPDHEIARRWLNAFPIKKGRKRIPVEPGSGEINRLAANRTRIKELRLRLSSVSWFMRGLNEFIGRRVNKEEDFKGRFWKGRFKCQVLLDESAYLACLAYVDLIPVLIGLKDEFDQCAYNSAHRRFAIRSQEADDDHTDRTDDEDWLCPIGNQKDRRGLLPISSNQYEAVLNWTQKHLKGKKRHPLPPNISKILLQLNIDDTVWVDTVKGYGQVFQRVAGRAESIKAEAQRVGNQWLCGFRPAEKLFKSPSPLDDSLDD